MRRLAVSVASFVLLLLLAAPVALADRSDGGEGWWGETDDKVVTAAGFILIALFPLFILVMSVIQWRLDKRKSAKLVAKRRRSQAAEWHGGW